MGRGLLLILTVLTVSTVLTVLTVLIRGLGRRRKGRSEGGWWSI